MNVATPSAAGTHCCVLRGPLGPPRPALRGRALCRRTRARAQATLALHHHLAPHSAPRFRPFSPALDEAPRPRLSHRYLAVLPLQRAHGHHPGFHHTRGHRRRAPRCTAPAASFSARTTRALLGITRCPLSLPGGNSRMCSQSARACESWARTQLASWPRPDVLHAPSPRRDELKWLSSPRLSLPRHPPRGSLRTNRAILPPALLLP